MNSSTITSQYTTSKAPRILVVDDDPRVQDTIAAQLYPEGYELLFKSSGVEALKQINELNPDVILLDLMMPGMNGFDVCSRLRHTEQFRHVPIIMVTALDDVDYLVTGLDTGADEFISKPVNGAELRARVRSMLRIKHQYDELDQALQLRELFSRMIVHDMRNPLSSILLYSQVMQRKLQLPPEQMNQVEMIQNEALRLGKLFDDMLILSRMQRGRLVLRQQPADLTAILNEVIQKHLRAATSQNIQLVLEAPADDGTLAIDSALIQRMCDTLVGNAVKFSPPGSNVTIQVAMGEGAEGRCASLEITDEGPTVPSAMLDQLFSKLEQNDTQYPGRPHTSIGLAFCRLVAEAHGGALRVRDNPTGGAIFTVDLYPPRCANTGTGEAVLAVA